MLRELSAGGAPRPQRELKSGARADTQGRLYIERGRLKPEHPERVAHPKRPLLGRNRAQSRQR